MTCSGLRVLPGAVRLFAYAVDGAPGPDMVVCLFCVIHSTRILQLARMFTLQLHPRVPGVRQLIHMRRNGHQETRVQRSDWIEHPVPRCHKKPFTANLASRKSSSAVDADPRDRADTFSAGNYEHT